MIETINLSKKYNKEKVLENVNIKIKQGKIYGFIGKNGAGKTTLMKILAGLVKQSEGNFTLFNENDNFKKCRARRKISFLIESPIFYENLNAKKNLDFTCILKGINDKSIVTEALKTVNLDTTNKKFGEFSLGMKQRLAIANILLGNPELIILDEPMNGLDPQGINEIRNIILNLNKEFNITFLISSHILSDLWLLASDFIFIDKGVIVEESTKHEIENKCKSYLSLGIDNLDLTILVLDNLLKISNYKCISNKEIHIYEHLDKKEKIVTVLQKKGVVLTHMDLNVISLEDYFLNLIKGD